MAHPEAWPDRKAADRDALRAVLRRAASDGGMGTHAAAAYVVGTLVDILATRRAVRRSRIRRMCTATGGVAQVKST